MTDVKATTASIDRPTKDEPQLRQCLRCQTTFNSDWSGERICPHCKSSAAWRQGMPPQSHRVGNHR
jgi:Zn finger protein HypA/HybF involved in hydrogenase expression